MTKPSQKVRGHTYLRDNHRCVAASNQCAGGIEWNHRENSGSGGRGSKAPELTTADGVTLCTSHNQRLEADLQDLGWAMGWKILRNRGSLPASAIPYFDCTDRLWYLPGEGATKQEINATTAQELLELAGNYRKKKVA